MAIQKFADEVMADGPIGYWRLAEAIGSVIAVANRWPRSIAKW